MNNEKCAQLLESFVAKLRQLSNNSTHPRLNKLEFEKDNDLNGHIDFIQATSNLRAKMYSIETADKMYVKKIAGKIVPAIATTTSCIAGFVSVELVRFIQQHDENVADHGLALDEFRNTFLNLAISLLVLSEPGACVKTKLTEQCSVSLWDKWTVKGNEAFTLRNFLDQVKQTYKLTCSSEFIVNKVLGIYLGMFKGGSKW